MEYMLDTANIEEIKYGIEYFDISGVTTNPSIIALEKEDFIPLINNILEIIKDRSLHLQVLSNKASDIIKEAHFIKETFTGNIYIKIPVTCEGLKAMKLLKREGFKITATGIISAEQIIIASKYADYMAPYYNRIENIGGNPDLVIETASKIIDSKTKILGASNKNIGQVTKSFSAGAKAVTLSLELLKQYTYHPYTTWSIEKFTTDFSKRYPNINSLCEFKK